MSISTGELIGRTSEGVDVSLGIPYAAPPFGENRFRLPQPVTAWSEPRDAGAFGPTSPQTPYRARVAEFLPSINVPGEDILTVNVWSPSGAKNLPVAVWIHGGAFEKGSAALDVYNGMSFARDGIVFVSMNYRLGSEGFSVIEGAPRNLGLEDAAAAVRWVRAEIASFGGDPDRITIFGESAGGSMVAALLSRPEGQLVAGAIMESGPLLVDDPEKGAKLSADLAKRLGVPATREGFLGVTPDDLLRARREQVGNKTILTGAPSFALTRDPDTLPVDPAVGVIQSPVPMIIGANSDEALLWFSPQDLAGVKGFKYWAGKKVLKVSKAAEQAYRQAFPDASSGMLFSKFITDLLLRGPGLLAAKARPARTNVYEFTWKTDENDLGAGHVMEVPFVFDDLSSPDAQKLVGKNAPQALADAVHGDWVQFITTQRVDWPVFQEGNQVRFYTDPVAVGPVPHESTVTTLIRDAQAAQKR
ncbi:carboxylesterase family protein [Microbacterium sp.]|uniref:carboxylesterase family protein n=1 Tax=Microbacterium sp. TaxID=51671 RepID=UPI0039E415EC